MFKKLSEKPVAEVQKEQVAKWKEEDLLHKCVTAREGAPSFVFYEGPPTANGKPGIHHVMARTLKDSINRYKTDAGHIRLREKAAGIHTAFRWKSKWKSSSVSPASRTSKHTESRHSTKNAVNPFSLIPTCGRKCPIGWHTWQTWITHTSRSTTTTSRQAGGF